MPTINDLELSKGHNMSTGRDSTFYRTEANFMICKMKLIGIGILCFFYPLAEAEKLKKSRSIMQQTHQEARDSQKKINRLDDESHQLLTQYRTTLSKTENLRIYNQQLSSYIKGQKQEIINIRKKIEEVKDTGKEIEPLMLRMLDSLKHYVDLDVPFLLAERKAQVQKLREILNRSDVSVSEKYRQLISAYKTERDYGRTLQSWRALRDIDGKELTVEYLRLGRLAFIYKSLDGKHLAIYDGSTREWKDLPKSYKKDIAKAIKISVKQLPPNLVKLPIPSTGR